MEVRQHSLCADFFSPIAVMHLYECISGQSMQPGMDSEKAVVQPNIIVIIAIIVIFVLSISRLIAIIGNNRQ